MTNDHVVDLDDTTACSVATTCENDGGCLATADLAVVTAASPFAGVVCLTLCVSCTAERALPAFTPLDALARAGQHAEHLGLDVDAVAALLDGHLAGRRSTAGLQLLTPTVRFERRSAYWACSACGCLVFDCDRERHRRAHNSADTVGQGAR